MADVGVDLIQHQNGTIEVKRQQKASIRVVDKLCHSHTLRQFAVEMNIHVEGHENLDVPSVWAFPHVIICLNCGFAEFVMDGEPLQELRYNVKKAAS